MKTYRGSKCIVPLILNHSSRWRSVAIFMPQLLEPWGKELDTRLDGPQTQSGCSGEEKHFLPLPGTEPRLSSL